MSHLSHELELRFARGSGLDYPFARSEKHASSGRGVG
jgi:hypothetical protein